MIEYNDNRIKDDYLYHYTSMNKAFEYILKNMSLRFSPFVNVNDPKESKKRDIGFNFISPHLYNNIGDYRNRMNQILLHDSRLLCFAEDGSDGRLKGRGQFYYRGFFKLRMWSQYGDDHRGVCLGFDRNILFEEFSKIKAIKSYRSRVKYTNSTEGYWQSGMLDYNPIDLDDFTSHLINSHIPSYRDTIYFTKALDWKDENEYRLLLLVESGSNEIFIDISKALKRVVLGIEFPHVYLESLKKLLNDVKSNAEIMQIDIRNGGIPEIIVHWELT